MSKILEAASVVIPGHGPPIFLDAELLRGLLERFPKAFQYGGTTTIQEIAESL